MIANKGDRLIAFIIDSVIITALSIPIAIIFQLFGLEVADDRTSKLVGKFTGICIYFPIMMIFFKNTIGKKLLKLKVIDKNSNKPSVLRILLRETIGRIVSPIVLGHFWIFFNKRNKTSWDYLAGTTVVKIIDGAD